MFGDRAKCLFQPRFPQARNPSRLLTGQSPSQRAIDRANRRNRARGTRYIRSYCQACQAGSTHERCELSHRPQGLAQARQPLSEKKAIQVRQERCLRPSRTDIHRTAGASSNRIPREVYVSKVIDITGHFENAIARQHIQLANVDTPKSDRSSLRPRREIHLEFAGSLE